ncbi:Indoleamine 2,3-dioxygenase [Aspergillus pseudotamarii]|uniref:Indoleamine 2,3-dioxygenase n=1 Tax=Aspergillus pseudotamarii TaxID=132259 RepID=A0A5N6T5F3_ASPPS|nr:Indoleamine 2,3-dioxygenase [Aspergillus pseudotamarii]KAE8141554.1 Indoleamine 2,3-dioxygenase [Aspergillus pseudotamarii]
MHHPLPIPNPSDYGLSPELGFLPNEAPLERLPDDYYAPWEDLVSDIPLLHHGVLQDQIERLPVLSTSRLREIREWRRAYVCLAFLLHGYMWGGEPRTNIPPCISNPLFDVCEYLQLPPIATFAAVCLWNYIPSRDEPTHQLDTLMSITSFTGTFDEEWFYLVSIAIEAHGAPIIPVMLQAIHAARSGDEHTVMESLLFFREKVAEIVTLLDRMDERCDPAIFYHQLRPFLAGTKSMEQFGRPDGITFTFNDGRQQTEPRSYRGGSNAQSSLIQFFDIVLGIEHTGGEGTFIHEMREYMPGPHRRFLQDVAKVADIRGFAQARQHSHPDVYTAYAGCLEMLGALRGRHLQIVAKYIISPSRKGNFQRRMQQTAGHCRQEKEKISFLGTGGTDLVPFLKQTLQRTIEPLTNI